MALHMRLIFIGLYMEATQKLSLDVQILGVELYSNTN